LGLSEHVIPRSHVFSPRARAAQLIFDIAVIKAIKRSRFHVT
jgi:hypothetical protein